MRYAADREHHQREHNNWWRKHSRTMRFMMVAVLIGWLLFVAALFIGAVALFNWVVP